jgi:short-subunit dehydrogenase
MNLRDRVVVVTGASSGIGWETALAFARKGAHLAVAARSEDKLLQLAALIQQDGGSCFHIPVDVTNNSSVNNMADKILEHFGRIDILVNNAGFGIFSPIVDADMKDIEAMMDVNYFGVVRCIQAVVPNMQREKKGHVVNVASVAGFMAAPTHGGYSATKFAVIGMSEALREEVRKDGIKVTTINPGPIDTPFFAQADLQKIPEIARRFMLKPQRVAQEIVKAVEQEIPQVIIPRSMASLVKLKGLAPRLFSEGTRKFYK